VSKIAELIATELNLPKKKLQRVKLAGCSMTLEKLALMRKFLKNGTY